MYPSPSCYNPLQNLGVGTFRWLAIVKLKGFVRGHRGLITHLYPGLTKLWISHVGPVPDTAHSVPKTVLTRGAVPVTPSTGAISSVTNLPGFGSILLLKSSITPEFPTRTRFMPLNLVPITITTQHTIIVAWTRVIIESVKGSLFYDPHISTRTAPVLHMSTTITYKGTGSTSSFKFPRHGDVI